MNVGNRVLIKKGLKVGSVVLLVLITVGIGELVFGFGVYGELSSDFGVYDDIHNTIVSTLCLSCIKLDPVSRLDFLFETANGEEHPEFVLENLTTGMVFIEYRSDVCKACDDMAPIVKDIFEVSFEKEDTLYELVNYNGKEIHFYHINRDHATKIQFDSFDIYDKDHIGGVPMFVIITVNYDRGAIKPCYTAAYGTLGLENDEERKNFLIDIIDDGISIYDLNHAGYTYP